MSVEPNSTELETRFSNGGREAFVEVYQREGRKVRHWVARFFRSPFEQEEAAQEVWLTVHRMQSAFDVNRGRLPQWLRALTANRCRELLRAKGRRPLADVPLDDDAQAQWLDVPGLTIDTALLRRALESFVASLPSSEAEVLRLTLTEELSHDEVAAQLGVTIRRSKYLKKKLLERAAADPALSRLAREVLAP